MSKYFEDRERTFEFLNKFEKIVSKDDLSLALLRTAQVELNLANTDANGKCTDIESVKVSCFFIIIFASKLYIFFNLQKMLDETQEVLDKYGCITLVHPPFYKMTSRYMDYTCDFASYYNETLKYLACEEVDLSKSECETYAIKLIVAAILGENLYDFGVLVSEIGIFGANV
jgi:hypothetical protein